jgi:hypothetical protein
MEPEGHKHASEDVPKHTPLEATATFAKLLQHPPKNAWNAVLTQLLSWSFRRFCVDRLMTDVSGSDATGLWDSHIELIADFAPPQFKPHLDNWLAPETLTHVGNLSQLDATFRHLVSQMDAAVAADDGDTQDELATLLDEEMGELLETWLGAAYAPYSIFPNSEEPDDSIDMTKLNAVIYLLGRQLTITKTVRTTLLNRRMTHRIRAATPIKKTRRYKKNVHVRFSSETRSHDSRGEGSKDDEGQRQQREGNKVSDSQEERDGQGEAPSSKQEGNHEHPQPQVHAESVHTSHEDTTVSHASISGAASHASIQQDNKEDEKERA